MEGARLSEQGAYIGVPLRRREDPRFLTGRGQYVEDVPAARCLYAAVVRSTQAHARLVGVDLGRARRHPAVVAGFAFSDLASVLRPLPAVGVPPPALAERVSIHLRTSPQYPLASSRVLYVGEPIALLVAEDRYAAADALELVRVEYAPLPAVVDVAQALRPDAPLLHEGWEDNTAVRVAVALGAPEGAFAEAPVRVRERLAIPRSAGMPIEPRGVLAVPDPRRGGVTVWASTQVPHLVQRAVAECAGLSPHRVRVVAPDVGGGFGTKCSVYPEDVLIPLAALRLDRPVKWIETRRQHLQSATHSREQVHEAEIAVARDGTVLAFRDRFLLDQGAYNPWGIVQPYNTVAHMLGPYRIRHAAFEGRAVVTNKTPHAPYRGAGRPEAVFVMERMLDLAARRLGMDPADVRRRNLIRPEEMPYDVGIPYRDGNPLVYDGGDFPAELEQALRAVGYAEVRRAQPEERRRGVYRGVGLAAYVEGTGLGPFESATVRLDSGGDVVVATGACSQGQGHETTFAQIAAQILGVEVDRVRVAGGDTDAVPTGVGTFASRSLVMAGTAVASAAQELRRKLVRAAAALLEAAEADVEISQGRAVVRGAPGRGLSLAELVQSSLPTFQGPRVADAVFEATALSTVPTVTYASAVHAAVVQVDPETGTVTIERYVVVHDCGRAVNPLIVEGQVHGGVAQGLGGALTEAVLYDGAGQILTASLLDYALPRASGVPRIVTLHRETPSPRNPLGAKGVGEGGAIAPPAALANAVEDALAPFGVRITGGPLTPPLLVALLQAGRSPRGGP